MTESTTHPAPQAAEPASAPTAPVEPQTQPVAPGTTPAAPRSRRVLRTAGRWSVALLLCAGLATGTAYGITAMERTDVPGLATESDGRWEYPKLTLPALPQGSPRPFTHTNAGEIHHADLRKLLLPAPKGARPDQKLPGGWVTPDRFADELESVHQAELKTALVDYGLRHIAGRGWTMPDGTSARTYLLRFDSGDTAAAFKMDHFGGTDYPSVRLAEETLSEPDLSWKDPGQNSPLSELVDVFVEMKPAAGVHVRQAYVLAGDTIGLVVHAKEGNAAAVPFHQTVALQMQLLS
ncbi:hypothetical protein [Streptomyces sp. NBC_00690]|uniref:hypothetical protein n=1 Tax=Streptomyces sp. NBC_00690 TaxID=2975808 RepID=UPI002E2DE768|nr:hypothetical protein [Streptomyces sp. NBC_00690]